MKNVIVTLFAVTTLLGGCAATQTADTATVDTSTESGVSSEYEATVLQALKDKFPGAALNNMKMTPPTPVAGKANVSEGKVSFSMTEEGKRVGYLFTYTMEGDKVVSLTQNVKRLN